MGLPGTGWWAFNLHPSQNADSQILGAFIPRSLPQVGHTTAATAALWEGGREAGRGEAKHVPGREMLTV